ncbi:hypothetical protein VCHC50A2_3262A, partial [Vibrio cholerae HC-50A2]
MLLRKGSIYAPF